MNLAPSHSRYVLRETAVSAAINMAMSGVLCFAMFGGQEMIRVQEGFATDFLPQSFMVGLMGALVPALLARRMLARTGATVERVRTVFTRSFILAAAALIGGGAMIVLLRAIEVEQLAFGSALAIKIAFGGVLALLVTPFALRKVLA